MAEQFERAVGDDLVGAFMFVEVPAPPWIMSIDELIVQFAGEDFVARLHDGVGDLAVEHAEFGVGQRGGFLHASQRADEVLVVVRRECRKTGKFSIAADRLHAVVSVVRALRVRRANRARAGHW